jgi:hypothetical protein
MDSFDVLCDSDNFHSEHVICRLARYSHYAFNALARILNYHAWKG